MTTKKAEAKHLEETPKGGHFYTEKEPNAITALAYYYKKKVSTEQLIVVSQKGESPAASYITKVTIL
jgi:hypothetical protein